MEISAYATRKKEKMRRENCEEIRSRNKNKNENVRKKFFVFCFATITKNIPCGPEDGGGHNGRGREKSPEKTFAKRRTERKYMMMWHPFFVPSLLVQQTSINFRRNNVT